MLGAKTMEVVETVRLEMVPRAGVEPARPFGQRILSPRRPTPPTLTQHYKPIPNRLTAVKELFGILGIITSQPHLSLIQGVECFAGVWDAIPSAHWSVTTQNGFETRFKKGESV
jgi:hypothetical protein